MTVGRMLLIVIAAKAAMTNKSPPSKRTVRTQIDAELFQVAARARMHREDQRQLGGNLLQRTADARHHLRAIDITRPVQRNHAVALATAGVRRLEGAGFKTRGVGAGQLPTPSPS